VPAHAGSVLHAAVPAPVTCAQEKIGQTDGQSLSMDSRICAASPS
jgi:hypothetical protein